MTALLMAIIAIGTFISGLLMGRYLLPSRAALPPSQAQPVCGCTHHASLHDPQSGKCHGEVVRYPYGRLEGTQRYDKCPCRRYVGPEPLASIWVPPITGGDG